MDLYAENILDHFRNPRSKQKLKQASVAHKEENLSCGDELEVELAIDAKGKVTALGWNGTGCAISQAAMSVLSDELDGMTIDAIESMQPKQIYELLGVPIGPRRFKCALLCLHTLKNTIRTHRKLPTQSWVETVKIDN